MKVLIVAKVKTENIGDIAIHISLRETLISRGHEVRGLDISRKEYFSEDEKLSKGDSYCSFLEKIQNIGVLFFNQMPFRLSRILKNLFNEFIGLLRYRKIWKEEIENADIVLIGGGALLHEYFLSWSFPISLYTSTQLIKKYKKPYGFVCCSVGDEYSRMGKILQSKSLEGAQFIFLRDPYSKELLEKLFGKNGEVVGDPAINIRSLFVKDENELEERDERVKERVLGINLMPFLKDYPILGDQEVYENYLKTMKSFVQAVLISEDHRKRFDRIMLFTTGQQSDLDACRTFRDSLLEIDRRFHKKVDVIENTYSIEDLIEKIKSFSAVVSTRLHSAIIPISFGIPVIGIAYNRKVSGFFRYLGLEKFCVNMEQMNKEMLLKRLASITEQKAIINHILVSHEKQMENMIKKIEQIILD